MKLDIKLIKYVVIVIITLELMIFSAYAIGKGAGRAELAKEFQYRCDDECYHDIKIDEEVYTVKKKPAEE
jgi:hypothetical protein